MIIALRSRFCIKAVLKYSIGHTIYQLNNHGIMWCGDYLKGQPEWHRASYICTFTHKEIKLRIEKCPLSPIIASVVQHVGAHRLSSITSAIHITNQNFENYIFIGSIGLNQVNR